ncbi:hypothetical protein OMP38_29045 [Cohnella ginsengisoli]|uniref:Secreted protein n=1 Tax=Cohnella ginsengisoli TaxID=425004 RepID=A0A9X4KMI2_9BACL|nr:hypothetical protein [Cohnella ginsengisoli]MDG0794431.1 hypothetical protein [Cohnella ginsengisoli]
MPAIAIKPAAVAVWSSLAAISGDTAAIAAAPQMPVPTASSSVSCRSAFSKRPSASPAAMEKASVPTLLAKSGKPCWSTASSGSFKPNNTMAARSSLVVPKRMPGANASE